MYILSKGRALSGFTLLAGSLYVNEVFWQLNGKYLLVSALAKGMNAMLCALHK